MSAENNSQISVIGGVYHEWCMRPHWDEIYGSAGRAALAIRRMGGLVKLHTYLSSQFSNTFQDFAALEGIELSIVENDEPVGFYYHHGLENPRIQTPSVKQPPLTIKEEKVTLFGMMEGSAIVDADYVVYDPQNPSNPTPFRQTGSSANHLALILNRFEARVFTGLNSASPTELAQEVARLECADVVVIKMGAEGALVYCNGATEIVPAYWTSNVWKIGSGDVFVASFSYAWMSLGLAPVEAARLASKATAYYCERSTPPTQKQLSAFSPAAIIPSKRYQDGFRPTVYLASPFFNLGQQWIVEQARNNLLDMGLKVFSPYHDVGPGSAEEVVQVDLDAIDACDLVYAVFDGLDPGTVYEVGYARAKSKPVVIYMENGTEEEQKMMAGSSCVICKDYVTSIYTLLWTGCAL